MAKETTDKLSKKKSKPAPSSNKSAAGGSKDKELLKKKKRVVEDDEDAAPKKRKRVVEDEAPKAKKKAKREADEDAAPKKKAKAEAAPAKSGSNPYSRPTSIVYQVFEMAKVGTSLKAIRSMLKEAGVQEGRVMRELRSGEYKGFRWKYTESEDGKISVKPIKAKSE